MATAQSSQQQYVPFLQERGLAICLTPDAQSFVVEPKELITDALRAKIITYRDNILSELIEAASQASQKPIPTNCAANAAGAMYSQPGHDLDEAEAAYILLFRAAVNSEMRVWLWESNEARPGARPYCYLKPMKLNDSYKYLPMLADEDGTDYVWAIH